MYHTLVMSGGASLVAAFLGSLRYLEHVCLLRGIRRFVGSSAGSLVALMLALGMGVDGIRDWTQVLMDTHGVCKLSVEGALDITDTLGIDSGDRVAAAVRATLDRWCARGQSVTFEEFAKETGKDLIVCTLNVTKQTPEYMCLETTPRMSVAVALRMSMSLPVLYHPVRHGGSLYTDPVLCRNFPYDFPGCSPADPFVLGMHVFKNYRGSPHCSPHQQKQQQQHVENNNNTLVAYLMQLLTLVVTNANNYTGKHQYTMIKICVDLNSISVFSMDTLEFLWNPALVAHLGRLGYAEAERVVTHHMSQNQISLVSPEQHAEPNELLHNEDQQHA